jgi:hypothetical protein
VLAMRKPVFADNRRIASVQRKLADSIDASQRVQQHRKLTASANANVLQRYSEVGEAYLWGYGKGTGAHAPTFEFQKNEATKVTNAAASTRTYGVDADQVFEDKPMMRVATDRSLAVPTRSKSEAKSFFATAGKIAESNELLHNAGAPLRLTQGAGQIRLSNGINPFGPTLSQVSPDLTNVVNNSSECGQFAEDILGTPVHTAETVNAGVVTQVPNLAGRLGRDATINNALGGQQAETLGGNRHAAPDVGEAFGIYARQPQQGAGVAAALWNGVLAVRNRVLGTRHLQWGEHWAGVVAKSGGDYVTLENYNRNAGDTDLVEEAAEEEYQELRNTGGINQYVANTQNYATQAGESRLQRLTRLGRNYMKLAVQIGVVAGHYQNELTRWYFQMYGSEGQSFHEQWKDSVPNAVTFKTHGTDAELKTSLVPKLAALLPADNYQAGANAALILHTGNVNAAAGRANIIAAYVAGEKAVCVARLNSANAHEQGQPHNAIGLAAAHAQALVTVNAASGDAVNVQCRAGIAAMLAT